MNMRTIELPQPILEIIQDGIPMQFAAYEEREDRIEAYNFDSGYRRALEVMAAGAQDAGVNESVIIQMVANAIAMHRLFDEGDIREY